MADLSSLRISADIKLVEGQWPTLDPDPAKNAIARVEFSGSRTDKARMPFAYSWLPNGFHIFLGQIALLWSMYETHIDELITAFATCCNVNLDDNWSLRWKYDRKERFIRDYIKTVFIGSPGVTIFLHSILSDAIPLQFDRNLLLHGKIAMFVRIHNNGGTDNIEKIFSMQVTGLRKGQIVEKRLYLEDLKRYFMILGTSLAGLER